MVGDDASPREALGNAGKGGKGDACARRGEEGGGGGVVGTRRRNEETERGGVATTFRGNEGRGGGGGGGKRIASVGPALSLIAGRPPLKIHGENFVPPSPSLQRPLYTGPALKLMAA